MLKPSFLLDLLNKISKKNILLLAVIVVLILPLFLLNWEPLKPNISNFILNQIKSRVNTDLIFEKPSYKFRRFKLFLSADSIKFKDKEETIISLKNFKLTYPLRNLFRTKQIISNISADKLFIKAIKNNDNWNLESIFKPGGKKVDFLFKSLKFHDTDLEIYSKGYFEKENVYLDIHRDNQTKLYKVQFYNNKTLMDTKDKAKLTQNNFYIAGDYDLKNNEGVYKYVKNLQVSLYQLKPSLINLISRAFTDRKSRFLYLFNKYSDLDTELSLLVKELDNEEEQYVFDLDLEKLANEESFYLDSKFQLAKDVRIDSIEVDFLKAKLLASGTVKNAFSAKTPILDLDIKLSNFNPYLLRDKFPELKEIISDKVAHFISTIHKSPVLDLSAKVRGDFFHPELKIELPVLHHFDDEKPAEKKFKLDLVLDEKNYLIKQLLIPFEFSDINVNGSLAKTGAFDLKLITQDLPIRSLKPIAMSFLGDKELRAIKDLVVQGYLKSDLQVKKQAKEKLPEFYGDITLAKASILEPNVPILMQNMFVELSAQKDLIKVSSFKGSLYENKVDLNGYYNIHTKEHKVNISSKSFDLAKIEGYQIKKYIPRIEKFHNIEGVIEGLEINSGGGLKDFSAAGKLVDVHFDYISNDKIINLKKIDTEFGYADEKLELRGFNAYVNDSSSLKLDGIIDFNNNGNTDLKISAVKLPFAVLSIIDIEGLPVHAKDGLVNLDLRYADKEFNGQGDLEGLVFNLDSKKMPENFNGVNGQFVITKDLFINGLTAYYGNSFIEAREFTIKDFLSDDKYYDLDINSNLKISEFESFIPSSVAELLHATGYLDLHVKAKGDTQKFYLDLDGNLNGVDSLVFSEWLDFDTSIKADFESSFSFTPKLILSKDTVLNLKNKNSATTVAADFEVHDWKEKKELRYSIDAYTPIDGNGNFIPVDLDLIEPHIKSIETLNLDPGTGTVQCRTDGALDSRHTFCDINFLDFAVAKNFGIGDLTSSHSSVHLIAVKDKPVYIKVKLNEGLWKVLDFIRVRFDMEITEDLMDITRLRAKLKQGFIRSNIQFNFKTLASKFKIKANNVSAHKAAESFFALGHEVPQGIVSGQFDGTTKGLLPDDMFFNLEAQASALVRDGKLSSLKTMQKLLSAVNTLKNFDFNNVFQTLITYEGGIFKDLVTYLKFNKGKITTEKLLLHSEQIELHLEGFVDYAQDYLMIRGLGAVPERSKSFLQLLGIKELNLGNLLSIINLRNPGSKDKDYFAFNMKGPVNDMEEATQSLRQNFTWLRSYGSSD